MAYLLFSILLQISDLFQVNNDLMVEPKQNTDSMVYTPVGLFEKSRVHRINAHEQLFVTSSAIKTIDIKTNKVGKSYSYDQRKGTSNFDVNDNGWMTYADYRTIEPTKFSTTYIVPSPPKESNSQILYLFNSLTWWSPAHIIQPVLQWGKSPAGGGNFWAICNWYVLTDDSFHDSLIIVHPGDTLEAVIERMSVQDTSCSYRSYFRGYSNGLQVNMDYEVGKQFTAHIAFETYFVTKETEYPADEKIRFMDISLESVKELNHEEWDLYNMEDSFHQYTHIVRNDKRDGIIEIHFHSPYSVKGFNEIHFYPNPVKDKLHISPDWIKNPLTYLPDIPIKECYIELYNLSGQPLYKRLISTFDFEFDLDLSLLKPGVYFIRFSYDNRSNSFKIIKE